MTLFADAQPLLTAPIVVELGPALRPVDAAEALRALPGLIFLDSNGPEGRRGRYSYVTADPFLVLTTVGSQITLATSGATKEQMGDPFRVVRRLLGEYRQSAVEGLPPFQGGAAGYFGYDLGRQIEALPDTAQDDLGLPDLWLGWYDWVVAWDHEVQRCWLMAAGLPSHSVQQAQERVGQVQHLLRQPRDAEPPAPPQTRLRSNFRQEDYLTIIRRAKEYIAAGDIYQVNLSQRFSGRWQGDPWQLYRRLRAISPVPYGAYLDLGHATVLSGSPECFLEFDGRTVVTHPIKGTRPRGVTPEEDAGLAAELLQSEKDRAENIMIVDLLRNDLGKVCEIGSVAVPRLFAIEGYSHVWQMVSTVSGTLAPGEDAVSLLRACFPGGSVTGCPKLRAMEIIEELEPVRRGVYCGAIGYVGFSGTMALNIVIRTLVLKDESLYLQVGGAIVADSDPQAEYEETLAKAAAAMAALRP